MLSPHLRAHGREALSYATIQDGMEYFIDEELGYVAFTTVTHPVFARRPKRIVLSDPVCSRENLPALLERFLRDHPSTAFVVISEHCAEVLRALGYKVNCIGPEPELPIQTYNTNGNWKELDMIKRARNEAKREGLVIREEKLEEIDPQDVSGLRRMTQRFVAEPAPAEACRAFVAEFTWENVARQLVDVYRRIYPDLDVAG